MGNCYSGDHLLKTIYIEIIICSIEKPHQKQRFGTVSNRLLWEGEEGSKLVLLDRKLVVPPFFTLLHVCLCECSVLFNF